MRIVWCILWIAFIVFCVFLAGCATATKAPASPPGLFGGFSAALAGISATTSWLVLISVLGIGAGIAAVVIMPGDDKFPWGVVIGSAAMLGVSLFIQTSLGLFPWIVGGCLIAGGLWLYSRIRGRKIGKVLGLKSEKP